MQLPLRTDLGTDAHDARAAPQTVILRSRQGGRDSAPFSTCGAENVSGDPYRPRAPGRVRGCPAPGWSQPAIGAGSAWPRKSSNHRAGRESQGALGKAAEPQSATGLASGREHGREDAGCRRSGDTGDTGRPRQRGGAGLAGGLLQQLDVTHDQLLPVNKNHSPLFLCQQLRLHQGFLKDLRVQRMGVQKRTVSAPLHTLQTRSEPGRAGLRPEDRPPSCTFRSSWPLLRLGPGVSSRSALICTRGTAMWGTSLRAPGTKPEPPTVLPAAPRPGHSGQSGDLEML